MRVSDLDFALPEDRIATRPAVPRDSAKLLVVGNSFEDRIMRDLPEYLRAGDVIVFNDTKVIPASLRGVRTGPKPTRPNIAALLHLRKAANQWLAFVKPAKKLEQGDSVDFGGLVALVISKGDAGEVTFQFEIGGADLDSALAQVGRVPLPPYIESKRPQDEQDRADYQTMFARHNGAVAAPTASLHFTPALVDALKIKGVQMEFVTLHVGAGTFLPIKVDDTNEHRMHSEWGEVPAAVAERLRTAKSAGRRIVPVGTTALRLLEASRLQSFSGTTNIFITPGYKFVAADALITNFHLPRSTLFALVAAFAGLQHMHAAYAHAINHDYRFYSYGDASLLFPAT